MLVISRDVTAYRNLEQSLETSEQRFRALADNIAQFAWMADSSGYVFWYNQRWFDYTGTTMAEMVGWGWKSVVHPEHLDRVVKKITTCFESGAVWEDVFPIRSTDGVYRWFLSRAMPIRDDSDRVHLWCGTNTDITEQRTVSQRLRQLARIIELSHEAMMAWDIDGGIVMWNKGCEELYGFTKAEAVGAVSHQLLKTRQSLPVAELERILATEGSWTGEVLHIDKDGDEVWVDSRQECIPVGGRNIILETNRDITDRRKADRQRDLMVAELNHRVRNTLAIVQSIASQTARSASDLDTFLASFTGRLQSLSSAHNLLTETHWSGAYLRRMITAELDVTASQTHRIVLTGEDIFLQPQAALQMSFILHELAINAMQHGALSTPAGSLDISWRVLDERPLRLQLIWKEHDGPAVCPPLQRGFGTSLIERSGRLPHLRTALKFAPDGVECTATVELAEEAPTSTYFDPGRMPGPGPNRTPRRPFSGARRVLIVEDQPLHAAHVEETLTEAGYLTIGPLHSVEAAVKGMAQAAFDVVLIDIDLPGLPLEAILTELDGRDIPVILMSEHGLGPQVRPPARTVLLKKPVHGPRLLEVVRGELARSSDNTG